MADVFERSGLGSANDFLTAARNRTLVDARDPRARSLEGYLFPDTYALPRSSDADDLVSAMLARFDQVFDNDVARRGGKSRHERARGADAGVDHREGNRRAPTSARWCRPCTTIG